MSASHPSLPQAAKSPTTISPLRTWVLAAGALAIGVIGLAVWLWLSRISGLQNLQLRIEAGKAALTAAAGTAAALGLVLAFRRQQSTEKFNRHEMHDATERRVTELYTKAADQLGSDRAAVRLAGVYALNRLAIANADQQTAIINVLCAYLRMPYPSSPPYAAMLPGNRDLADTNETTVEWKAEGEVRQAIVNVLTETQWIESHPSAAGDSYHPSIDLSGATIRSIIIGKRSLYLSLRGATITGKVIYVDTQFFGLLLENLQVQPTGDILLDNVSITEPDNFSVSNMTINGSFRVTPATPEESAAALYNSLRTMPNVTISPKSN